MIMKIDKTFTIGSLIGWFILSPILTPKYFDSLQDFLLWSIIGLLWSIILGLLVNSLQEYYKSKKKLEELRIEMKVLSKLIEKQEKTGNNGKNRRNHKAN